MTTTAAQTTSTAAVKIAERELGRFLTLAVEGVPSLGMFSTFIDGVWHGLLENDEAYRTFCGALGLPAIGHVPLKGAGTVSWIPEYERRYGKLDDVWFLDADGVLNEALRRKYHSDGTIECSWDCTPLGGTE